MAWHEKKQKKGGGIFFSELFSVRGRCPLIHSTPGYVLRGRQAGRRRPVSHPVGAVGTLPAPSIWGRARLWFVQTRPVGVEYLFSLDRVTGRGKEKGWMERDGRQFATAAGSKVTGCEIFVSWRTGDGERGKVLFAREKSRDFRKENGSRIISAMTKKKQKTIRSAVPDLWYLIGSVGMG